MSLLDGLDLTEIKLYYKYIKVGNNKKLVVLDNDKAEEILKEDEAKAKEIETLETQWSILNWREQNEVMSASSKAVNAMTGEKQFNFLAYRDAVVKRCLKSWNIKVNDQPVPVTPDAIDRLPGPIVINIYQQYEAYINFSEDELGN